MEKQYGRMGGRSWVEWKWDGIEEACMKRPDRVLVSEVGGEVAGFAMFELDPVRRIGTVGNNAVHPRFRGLGVGRRQQDRILAIFREKGMRFAEVVVGLDEGHATARAMYASTGFEKLADSRHLFMRLDRRRRAKPQ
jgi:ribosomal protein S18 acetylase RimI-like enzyme